MSKDPSEPDLKPFPATMGALAAYGALGTPQLPHGGAGADMVQMTDLPLARRLRRELEADKRAAGKTAKALKLTKKSFNAFERFDYDKALALAHEATGLAPEESLVCYALALALEAKGELHKAILVYERVLKLNPSEYDAYARLGTVAYKLEMWDAAERFLKVYLSRYPHAPEQTVELAHVYKATERYDMAVAVLQAAAMHDPAQPQIWNQLGTVAQELTRFSEAKTFFEEAIRLDPDFSRAYYNLGFLLNHTGPVEESLALHDEALNRTDAANPDRLDITYGRAICNFALGRLEQGWADYEVRHDLRFGGSIIFAVGGKMWSGEPLAGKRLLIVGEQGIGDELMFANAIPEVAEAIGPEGKLYIACDQRLHPIMRRSFPTARVGEYATTNYRTKKARFVPWLTPEDVDYFVPMGSIMRFYRGASDAFPSHAVLTGDATRTAEFRERLQSFGPGPYVGLCWRSMIVKGTRRKFYCPVEKWGPVLGNRAVTFVNLQYGDSAEDIAAFERLYGTKVHSIEGLDLKNDMDGTAAAAAALDLVISAPTAQAALAGTTGTEVWVALAGLAWPTFGTTRYPFYAKSRSYYPSTFGDWSEVMTRMGADLVDLVAAKAAAA